MFSQQTKIIVGSGFAALLMLMFALISIGYSQTVRNLQQMEQLIEIQNKKTALVLTMQSSVQSRVEQALRMADTRDPFESDNAFMRMGELAGEYIKARTSLSPLLSDKKEELYFREISVHAGRSSSMLQQFIDLMSEGREQQARVMLVSQVIPLQNTLLNKIRGFMANQHDIAQREINLTKTNYNNTLRLLSYMVILAVIVSAIIVGFVIRRISRAEKSLFAEGVLQSIGDAVITTDAAGKVTYLNGKAVAITHLDEKSAIGKTLNELFTCIDAESGEKTAVSAENQLLDTAFNRVTRILIGSGKLKDIEYSMSPIRDHNAIIRGTVMAFRDITSRNAIQDELRSSQELLSLVMQGTNDGIWDYSLVSGEIYFSSRWKEMLGYNDDEFVNTFKNWQQHIHTDDLGKILIDWADCMSGSKDNFQLEYRMMKKDKSWKWIECRGLALLDNEDKPIRLSGSHTDISARKNAEQALFTAKQHAEVTLRSIGDAVITVDLDGTITFMNSIAETITGWTRSEAAQKPYDEILNIVEEDSHDILSVAKHFTMQDSESRLERQQAVLINRYGDEYSIEQTIRPLLNDEGGISGYVAVVRDVSTERKLKRQLYWQANHDSLTGLVNRASFETRLVDAIVQARDEDSEHALLYMDLDQFKVVNDTCGHIAGDELLRQLASTLKNNIRQTDTLARLGGDEFGILLDHCSLSYATDVAKSIREVVSGFRFAWEDKTFEIGVCIGVVPINSHSASKQAVMSAADIACYAAKDLGRNRIHIYQEDDTELSLRHGEMRWVSRITEALQRDRFVLYKQAIIPIDQLNGDETHFEILVRMLDDDGSVIPPGAFIPAAERYNLMSAIDRWVIKTLFSEFADISAAPGQNGAGGKSLYTINLSGNSVNDSDFLEFVRDMIRQHNLPAGNFCFEITETSAIANLSSASDFICELKKLGCLFALDDFGSGLSSFGYLKNLPVDFLKIDGQFVKDIVDDAIDAAMVRSINEIGHVMGMKTIAEFVENDAILERLKDIGVDFAQGYGVSKPEPLIAGEQRKTAS